MSTRKPIPTDLAHELLDAADEALDVWEKSDLAKALTKIDALVSLIKFEIGENDEPDT